MKNRIGLAGAAVVFLCATFIFTGSSFAKDLVIASFEKDGKSDIGTTIGTWSSNTLDTSQGSTMKIIPLYGVMGRASEESHVLKLTYDVATTGPAFNGIYIDLPALDLTPYKRLSMLIKGDPGKGFTTRFKVELANNKGQRGTCLLSGITADWQQLSIPMKEFKADGVPLSMRGVIEMDITFDDMTVDKKQGTLYIDEIKFSTE